MNKFTIQCTGRQNFCILTRFTPCCFFFFWKIVFFSVGQAVKYLFLWLEMPPAWCWTPAMSAALESKNSQGYDPWSVLCLHTSVLWSGSLRAGRSSDAEGGLWQSGNLQFGNKNKAKLISHFHLNYFSSLPSKQTSSTCFYKVGKRSKFK